MWVGLVGLFSLCFGIVLVPLALLYGRPFRPIVDGQDFFISAFGVALWLGPLMLAYSVVLTSMRSGKADWRRGLYLLIAVIASLAFGLWGLEATSR